MSNVTKNEPTKGWHKIHDFLFGFGLQKWESDGVDGASNKIVFARDAARLLKIDIFRNSELDFDTIYEQIQPLIEAEREKRRQEPHMEYKKFYVPKINRSYPPL